MNLALKPHNNLFYIQRQNFYFMEVMELDFETLETVLYYILTENESGN